MCKSSREKERKRVYSFNYIIYNYICFWFNIIIFTYYNLSCQLYNTICVKYVNKNWSSISNFGTVPDDLSECIVSNSSGLTLGKKLSNGSISAPITGKIIEYMSVTDIPTNCIIYLTKLQDILYYTYFICCWRLYFVNIFIFVYVIN